MLGAAGLTLRRPSLPALVLAGAGTLAFATVLLPIGYRLFFAYLALVALGSLAYVAWHVDPAWSICAAVAASLLNTHWSYLGVPDLPYERVALAFGVAALLLRAPGALDRPRLRLSSRHWWLALSAGYVLLSAAIAGTLLSVDGSTVLIDRLTLTGFVLFLVAPIAFWRSNQRQALLVTLVAMGAYLGATALFEALHLNALVFPRYILDPTIGSHIYRARGPFLEAAVNGTALYACGVAAVVALTQWKGIGARWFALAVAVLCAVGCIVTLQRSVWLGSAVATLVTLAAFAELRRVAVPVTVALLVGVLGALALIPGLGSQAAERRRDQLPIWDRKNLSTAAINMFEAHPLFGAGWNRFQADSAPYFVQRDDVPLVAASTKTRVHSVGLSNLAETGLVGTTLWVLALITAIGGAIVARGPPELLPWRIGLLAITIQWLIVSNLIPMTQVLPNLLPWLWAGIVLSWRASPSDGA